MSWEPISESDIQMLIEESLSHMTPKELHLWDLVKIKPEKWPQTPYGEEGGGFWVVATIGNLAVWYNDIEEGFNISHFSEGKEILEYYCNQDELLVWPVRRLLDYIEIGRYDGYNLGAPEPIAP